MATPLGVGENAHSTCPEPLTPKGRCFPLAAALLDGIFMYTHSGTSRARRTSVSAEWTADWPGRVWNQPPTGRLSETHRHERASCITQGSGFPGSPGRWKDSKGRRATLLEGLQEPLTPSPPTGRLGSASAAADSSAQPLGPAQALPWPSRPSPDHPSPPLATQPQAPPSTSNTWRGPAGPAPACSGR